MNFGKRANEPLVLIKMSYRENAIKKSIFFGNGRHDSIRSEKMTVVTQEAGIPKQKIEDTNRNRFRV